MALSHAEPNNGDQVLVMQKLMVMQTKQHYPTNLTESQWNLIKEILPEPEPNGRPRELDMRQVVNAILYLVVGGIQ